MIARVKSFALIGLFWLAYMIVTRLVFLLYNFDLSSQLAGYDILLTFVHGLRMDLSATGYFLLIYGLLFTFSVIWPASWWKRLATGYTLFLLLLCGTLVVVDEELYRHWGFRLNTTPFQYLGSGTFGSITLWVLAKGLLVFAVIFSFSKWGFDSFVRASLTSMTGESPAWAALGMILLTASLFLPIRGSISVAPMNAGFVYFHRSKPFANHSALNLPWNFLSSLRKSSNIRYPEDFFDREGTARIMKELFADTLVSHSYLRVSKPNLLLIVLEGFGSGIIEPLGGMGGITPNLNALVKEGLLFSRIYSSGDRTDKGLVSILSGYPSQTETSIVKFPSKTERLPSLTRTLEKMGYHSSFIYGGDADFANFRSYLTNIGFADIVEMDDFPSEQNTSKWGVHDQFLFQRLNGEIAKAKKPFFKTVLTLSSHEPFDVPMKEFAGGKDEEEQYLNSCKYTDHCVGQFLKEAKRQAWWDSTLVVITADHGHRHPGNKSLQDEKRFRIPLLLLGGALGTEAREIAVVGSQTDIANTILGQIARPDSAFRFSRDLLSPGAQSFAPFYFQNGYGFVQDGKTLVYDHQAEDFVVQEGAITPEDIRKSKAYQQAVFSDFNSR